MRRARNPSFSSSSFCTCSSSCLLRIFSQSGCSQSRKLFLPFSPSLFPPTYLSTFSHLHQPYRESSLLFNVVTSFTAIEPILRGFPESTRRSVHARRRFDHVSRYPRKRPRGIYVRGTRSPFVEGGREREGGREEKRKRESE